jgi:hypothetical protein
MVSNRIAYRCPREGPFFESADCATDAREHLRITCPPLSACYVLDESLGFAALRGLR